MILRNSLSVSFFLCILIVCVLYISIMMTHGGAWGSRSGPCSGSSTKPIDEGLHDFILLKIVRGILDVTHMMFRIIKERIVEMVEERFWTFQVEMFVG